MSRVASKITIWENLTALMTHRWGEVNISRLAREAKLGQGTAQRLQAQATSVGLDVVDKLADYFRIATWQLLVPQPQFAPDNPPVLQPLTEAEKRLYEGWKRTVEEYEGAIAREGNTRPGPL